MGLGFSKTIGGALGQIMAEAAESREVAIKQRVLNLGFDFDDGTATVYGIAADDDTPEKVLVAVGNIEGVESVEDEMDVRQTEA